MAKAKTTKDMMNDLFTRYGLTSEHVFKHAHYTIITRGGIDQIQASAGIHIEYEFIESLCNPQESQYVIKATGSLGDSTITTFGEVSAENNRNKYPVAMAEKRAMSRLVLKLAGLYALGAFGEDEADDFKDVVKQGRKNKSLTPTVK